MNAEELEVFDNPDAEEADFEIPEEIPQETSLKTSEKTNFGGTILDGKVRIMPEFAKENREELRKLLKSKNYVHLHNHTNYSVLDGLTKIPELVSITKEFGQDTVAMTDHGNLNGWLTFQMAAENGGVKPILGIETYVAARGHLDKDPQKDKARYHLTVLAMNEQGRKNLMSLSSIANLEGVYYKPRIDHELLEKYNEGLIVLSGCASGEVGESLRQGDYEKARDFAKWYKSVFGDRYFMEIQDHGHPDAPKRWDVQTKINEGVLRISEELDIPAVVTCDAHYVRIDDTDAHEILLCVGTGSFLSDTKRMSLKDFHLHITDPAEIIERWGKDHPEVILNSRLIADRCEAKISTGHIYIPKYPIPEEKEKELREIYDARENAKPESERIEWYPDGELFHQLVWRGLAYRYGGQPKYNELSRDEARKILPKNIVERADYEIEVIDKMGYDGYFLVVQDFINWGKDQGVVYGPGRGSAAGAIVTYALSITELDPMQYDLLFERFLNPDRISMPDIDVDIQDTRRDDVIRYCTEKYGADAVTNIVTFGTMAAKQAYKDVARVLEVPFSEANRVAGLIEAKPGDHRKLPDYLTDGSDLKKEYDNNPTVRKAMDLAIRLEGTIRSHGVHASGVVIAPDKLTKFIPLEMAQKGVVSTQFPGPQVEEIGLLKFDFLGLSNLTVISDALKMIKKIHGKDINMNDLGLDDEKVFELFQNGETIGVFQFESAGMQRYMKELKPTKFEDLIAMNALYRPGPMSEIPTFIARAHGDEPVTYDDPGMEQDLKDTYGVLVYQEQFMNISKNLCGFTGGEADTLRKAVAKKKIDLMREMKSKFIDGAVNLSGADRQKMEKFWDHLEDFASYCFNKSHAACYSLIAYWTAWLKVHYPAEFMAALMTSDFKNTDRLTIEISECNRMGIRVLNPEINQSFIDFAVVPKTGDIRFGFSAIKGVGGTAIESILGARNEKKFESVEDFARRTDPRVVNKRVWESLIKSGAFDGFAKIEEASSSDDPLVSGDRSDLLFALEDIIAFAGKIHKEAASGQESLLGMLDASDLTEGTETHLIIPPSPSKLSQSDILASERELMGLYLSAHPLDKFATYFRENYTPLALIKSSNDGALADIGGLLSRYKAFTTKSGSKMAFCSIEDKTKEVEFVIFPKTFEKLQAEYSIGADAQAETGKNFDPGVVIHLKARVQGKDRDGLTLTDPTLVAEEIEVLTDETAENYRPTGIEKGGVDMKTVATRRTFAKKNSGSSVSDKTFSSQNFSKKSGDSSYAKKAQTTRSSNDLPAENYVPVENVPRKLFIHIKNPSDAKSLEKLRDVLKENSGESEIILVLGEDKKDAVRMPMRAKISDSLLSEIADIYDQKAVFVK